MNIEHYQNFQDCLKKGLKKQASKYVSLFVDSFESEDEIESWVWGYLPCLETNNHSCIRHELFNNLVYPVLRKGYEANDYRSTLWLGKLVQNICQTKGVFEDLGFLGEMDFYRKCYDIDPSNTEGNELLVNSILTWLSYCEHEWPSAILYGMDGADIEQCKDIRDEANFAVYLSKNKSDKEFVMQFLGKLDQYEKRLNKKSCGAPIRSV
ncbi:hypothetical protein ACJJIK_02250 [Microbulbifer sp. ZKSA006]|uniref:hypothetical protein n=1 Tax=Microbulbifer sp. ZKSA006 TaxID=3243390 RepID=UPI004039F1E8